MSGGISIPRNPKKAVIGTELYYRLKVSFVLHYDDGCSQGGEMTNRNYLSAEQAKGVIDDYEAAMKAIREETP